jgi:hypothetical protein
MSDPVKDVDQFVEQRSRRPVWAAGWAIFLAASAFTAHTMIDLPQQNALVAQDRAVATRYAQIAAKLDMVPKAIELVVDTNIRAVTFFRSEIESSQTAQGIRPSTVAEARRLIAETRGGIDTLMSVFDSLQLGESDADAMIAKFREDLSALDQVLVPRERVVLAILAGDLQMAATLLGQVRSDPEGKLTRQLTAFGLRTTAFAQMAETKKLEHAADLEARRVRRSDYQQRIYFLVFSTGYMGAFLFIAARAWRRDRSASKVGANQQSRLRMISRLTLVPADGLRPLLNSSVNVTGLRIALWRCDLGAELPHLADGSPRPKAVEHRIEKQSFNAYVLR